MGLNPWQEDFFLTVRNFDHQAQLSSVEPYCIVDCQSKFYVHLVPLQNNFEPASLLALQTSYAQENKFLVQLWEDVWLAKRSQVLGRVKSFLGLNKSYHGRKAKIENLTKKQISIFLNAYHLQDYVKAAYNFGLVVDGEVVAAASFSKSRPMKTKGADYQSAELVRFASKEGITVVGGLSKLIKHFTKQVKINDLMTYADRDWSLGKGYHKLGFNLSETTLPTTFYVNRETLVRYFLHRLPKEVVLTYEAQKVLNLNDFLLLNGYVKIFNTGNLKYHLYL